MALTWAEALAKLTNPENLAKYSQPEQLFALVRETSAPIPGERSGAVTVPHSGPVTDPLPSTGRTFMAWEVTAQIKRLGIMGNI